LDDREDFRVLCMKRQKLPSFAVLPTTPATSDRV
jgi:hypothetical protein